MPLAIVVWNGFEVAETATAPRPLTSRPSPADPGSRRRHRRRAPGSRGSTTAPRRISEPRRSRRSPHASAGSTARCDRHARTGQDPCPGCRSRPGGRADPRRTARRPWPAHRRLRTPPSARHEAQRAERRPRASGTATRGPGRCLRWSCSRRHRCVAERLDDLVGGDADVGDAPARHAADRRDDAAHRGDLAPLGIFAEGRA